MDKDLIVDLVEAAGKCNPGALTTWELDFIESISLRDYLSEKQRDVAVELTDKIEGFPK